MSEPAKPNLVSAREWGREGWDAASVATDAAWRGHVDGETLGTQVTVLFYATDEIGVGPRLHVHPYDEIFIVKEGNARFTVGGRVLDAGPGDVVLGPANQPHKYKNLGPGRLVTTDVHLSPRWIQTNLDDPDEDQPGGDRPDGDRPGGGVPEGGFPGGDRGA